MSLVTCHELTRKFCFFGRRKFSDVVFIYLFLEISLFESIHNGKQMVQKALPCSDICYLLPGRPEYNTRLVNLRRLCQQLKGMLTGKRG